MKKKKTTTGSTIISVAGNYHYHFNIDFPPNRLSPYEP